MIELITSNSWVSFALSLGHVQVSLMHGVQNFGVTPSQVLCRCLHTRIAINLLRKVTLVFDHMLSEAKHHTVARSSEVLGQGGLAGGHRVHVERLGPRAQRVRAGHTVRQNVVGTSLQKDEDNT